MKVFDFITCAETLFYLRLTVLEIIFRLCAVIKQFIDFNFFFADNSQYWFLISRFALFMFVDIFCTLAKSIIPFAGINFMNYRINKLYK